MYRPSKQAPARVPSFGDHLMALEASHRLKKAKERRNRRGSTNCSPRSDTSSNSSVSPVGPQQLSAAGPFAIRTHVALSTKTSAFKKVELSTAFERRKQVELSTTAFERQLAALDSFKKAARVSAFSVLRKPETKSDSAKTASKVASSSSKVAESSSKVVAQKDLDKKSRKRHRSTSIKSSVTESKPSVAHNVAVHEKDSKSVGIVPVQTNFLKEHKLSENDSSRKSSAIEDEMDAEKYADSYSHLLVEHDSRLMKRIKVLHLEIVENSREIRAAFSKLLNNDLDDVTTESEPEPESDSDGDDGMSFQIDPCLLKIKLDAQRLQKFWARFPKPKEEPWLESIPLQDIFTPPDLLSEFEDSEAEEDAQTKNLRESVFTPPPLLSDLDDSDDESDDKVLDRFRKVATPQEEQSPVREQDVDHQSVRKSPAPSESEEFQVKNVQCYEPQSDHSLEPVPSQSEAVEAFEPQTVTSFVPLDDHSSQQNCKSYETETVEAFVPLNGDSSGQHNGKSNETETVEPQTISLEAEGVQSIEHRNEQWLGADAQLFDPLNDVSVEVEVETESDELLKIPVENFNELNHEQLKSPHPRPQPVVEKSPTASVETGRSCKDRSSLVSSVKSTLGGDDSKSKSCSLNFKRSVERRPSIELDIKQKSFESDTKRRRSLDTDARLKSSTNHSRRHSVVTDIKSKSIENDSKRRSSEQDLKKRLNYSDVKPSHSEKTRHYSSRDGHSRERREKRRSKDGEKDKSDRTNLDKERKERELKERKERELKEKANKERKEKERKEKEYNNKHKSRRTEKRSSRSSESSGHRSKLRGSSTSSSSSKKCGEPIKRHSSNLKSDYKKSSLPKGCDSRAVENNSKSKSNTRIKSKDEKSNLIKTRLPKILIENEIRPVVNTVWPTIKVSLPKKPTGCDSVENPFKKPRLSDLTVNPTVEAIPINPLIEEEEDDEELYCICRTKNDPTRPMVQCDRCEEWFHFICVGYFPSPEDLEEAYVCPKC